MWKRAFIVALVVVMSGITGHAQTWTVDKAHSSIGFAVRHMVISTIKGKFNDFSGTITFDGTNVSRGVAEMTVQVGSIDTDNVERDEHLRSDEFLAAEEFPAMTFVSEVVVGKRGTFQLVGDLTIRGVTKRVIFDGVFNGTLVDPWGKERAGFSAQTIINRLDFGVSFSKLLDNGGLLVSNDVTILLELEVIKDE